MTDNVIHLVQPLGDGAHIDADQILEQNKGVFRSLVIAGYDQDGQLVLCGTDSTEHSVFLLERAKLFLLTHDVERT